MAQRNAHLSRDPDKRVDLVFLGDGYTADEQSKFADDVNRTVQVLFSDTPLLEYAAYWNVHLVYVVSRESGVDHPLIGIYRDTALNFIYAGGCAATHADVPDKVLTAAADAPASPDVIVVLINDKPVGGCANSAYATVVVGTDDRPPYVVGHELGHLFGGLADEGIGLGSYHGSEPLQSNATIQTARSEIKCCMWIDSEPPLPTSSPSDKVGLFEGVLGYRSGVYRPIDVSKMSVTRAPWGPVNGEALIKQMYSVVSLVDGAAPSETFQDLTQKAAQTFTIATLQPTTGPLPVDWQLDGQRFGMGPELILRAADAPAGDHVLAALVEDRTPLVRNRSTGPALSAAVSWTVRFPNHPPQMMVPDHVVVDFRTVVFTVTATDVDRNLQTLEIVDPPVGSVFVLLGDLDGNGRVDQLDAPLLLSGIFSREALTIAQREAADVNIDGRISAPDITALSTALTGTQLAGRFFWLPSSQRVSQLTFRARDAFGAATTETVMVTMRPTPTPRT